MSETDNQTKAEVSKGVIVEFDFAAMDGASLLYGVTEASPAYQKAQDLLKFIEPVIALKPMEIAAIPPTSIMREFIGGQTL